MVKSRRRGFTLVFAPETIGHLNAIDRRHHGLVRQTIDEQLTYTPEQATRNRKPLERPSTFEGTWELRFGPKNRFRVFYEVRTAEGVVHVLAIGIKEGNRLFVSGKEVEI